MKLTTKLALIYLAVTVIVGAGLGLFGIPYLRNALEERERNYAISYLERESQILWTRLKRLKQQARDDGWSDEKLNQEQQRFFEDVKTTFAKFYFHNSGRLFVIAENGEIMASSDETKNGRTVSNMWIYKDGQREQLLKDMSRTGGSASLVREFRVQELQGGHRITKNLFVSVLPGTKYYVCVSVNEEDLYYSANWISKALLAMLAILILILYMLFHIFYTSLRKRYDQIIEHAELIAKGNYDVVIGDTHEDEVGILARTIDRLARSLEKQRSLEGQLRQIQKMEMMGTLASGIAHDFNNTLGGIMSALELVGQEIRSPANKQKPDLSLIQNTIRVASDCANRGKETVEQLLTFSRKSESHKQLADLNRCVRNVYEICQHSFDKRITVRVEEKVDQAVILADRSHLEQAILNVCINARDAMAEGGKLTITVQSTHASPHDPDSALEPADVFRLTIEDTGTGMNKDTLKNVFEPFYTTKKSGTGLGLAMVYSTIDDHDGWIDIDSQLGLGTKFHIYLPQAEGKLETPSSTTTKNSSAQEDATLNKNVSGEGSETILVVDDDDFMLQMTIDILTRLGYRTLTAKDGREGLEVFAENQDDIDMLLLDLMLPEVSGDVVFAKVKEAKPDIRVLLISGHKRDPRIADLLGHGCDGFLNKPYTIEELSTAVRQTLD